VSEKVIFKSLIAAKMEFKPLVKNKVNPHFKSKYADLSAVAESVDEALAKHGLTYIQPLEYVKEALCVVTRLTHTSGEELLSTFPLPPGTPQQMGSAITYGRRFSLCSLLGICADDDDDANAASTPAAPAKKVEALEPPIWIGHIKEVLPMEDKGTKFLKITGVDGMVILAERPPEKDKARLDIYGMWQKDLEKAIGGDEMALTYRVSAYTKNKILLSCKVAEESVLA
jgi:hypothetical protein